VLVVAIPKSGKSQVCRSTASGLGQALLNALEQPLRREILVARRHLYHMYLVIHTRRLYPEVRAFRSIFPLKYRGHNPSLSV